MALVEWSAARSLGSGLSRPECVLAHSSGLLFAPDWTEPGGVSAIAPNGGVRRILATRPSDEINLPVRPNGIALEPGGRFLIAHLGDDRGGVYRLDAFGRCEVVVDRIDGEPAPPTNFVARAADGGLWITVSTRKRPRSDDYRPDADSGFIAYAAPDARDAKIVADGLGYANECLQSPDGGTLWVNETFGRRLTAFDVVDDGLVNKRTVASFGSGVFPDGLALAADGSLIVVSVVSNQVLRIHPDAGGAADRVEVVLEDRDGAFVETVEQAFQAGEMGPPHLAASPSTRLRNVSNLAFGGDDFSVAYLGSLLGDAVVAFDCPFPGLRPPHWSADLGPLTV